MSLLGTAVRVAVEVLIDLVSGKLEKRQPVRRPKNWTRQAGDLRDEYALPKAKPGKPPKS